MEHSEDRFQHLQNIKFETRIDQFGQLYPALWSKMYLFVVILVNCRHLVFPIGQSNIMDLVTIELSHANFGACTKIATILPKNAHCMLHCNNVTTCPNGNVTACPNVISHMKFVGPNCRKMCILNLANDIQGSVYTHDHGHGHFYNIYSTMY